MQKGFSVPFVLIIVGVLSIVMAGFWSFSNDINLSSSKEIKGVAAVSNANAKPGFSVYITSTSGTWDLVEYLCTSLSECTKSATAGKKWSTLSGGQTNAHEVVIDYAKEWKDYAYIKFFVKPGWASSGNPYSIKELGAIPDSKKYELTEDNASYEVVIVPTKEIENNYYTSASFSN